MVESGIPYWEYSYLGQYNEAETAIMPTGLDHSSWLDAAIASPRTVPLFLACGVEPSFKTCRIDLGGQTNFRPNVNEEYVSQAEHDGKATLTWDALPVGVLNLENLIATGATAALELRIGTAAGRAIHVHAPTAGPTGYTLGDDQGVVQHNVDLSLYPVTGGDDVVFSVL